VEDSLLQLHEQHGIQLSHRNDFLLSIDTALDSDGSIRKLNSREEGARKLSLDLGITETTSNEALEATNRVARVCHLLILGEKRKECNPSEDLETSTLAENALLGIKGHQTGSSAL
jgi:hypothetical protein